MSAVGQKRRILNVRATSVRPSIASKKRTSPALEGQSNAALPHGSHVNLLRDCKRVIHLDPEVTDCAFADQNGQRTILG